MHEAVPQSLRQQELVCLTNAHVNCPRYLRGAAAVTEVPPPVVGAGRSVTPAILGSIILLVGAFVLSVGFVASRGGMDLTGVAVPSTSPSATAVAAAASPAPTVSPASSAAAVATPTPTVTSTPSPSPTPTASPTPTPSPTPGPTRTPKPSAKPSSSRYALLTACAGSPRCWVYRVRAGDNLYSIANYFGVKQARIYAMNPWLRSSGLRSGQSLRLPPPTR